jgi:hypothetical protein
MLAVVTASIGFELAGLGKEHDCTRRLTTAVRSLDSAAAVKKKLAVGRPSHSERRQFDAPAATKAGPTAAAAVAALMGLQPAAAAVAAAAVAALVADQSRARASHYWGSH